MVELLKRRTIDFEPPLSPIKELALTQISTEAATKLFFAFSERVWDPEMTYMCHTGLFPRCSLHTLPSLYKVSVLKVSQRWWVSSWQRDSDVHVIACFATSDRAKISDQMTDSEALSIALTELSALLGKDLALLKAKCELPLDFMFKYPPYFFPLFLT